MTRAAQPDNSVADDLERLADLLGESYEASYKSSSLKVRRRYRKLLAALEAVRQQRAQVALYSLREREPVAARRGSPQ